MFGLVLDSDGQNEGLSIMALIFIAQLALLLCEIVSVCYTCTYIILLRRAGNHCITTLKYYYGSH